MTQWKRFYVFLLSAIERSIFLFSESYASKVDRQGNRENRDAIQTSFFLSNVGRGRLQLTQRIFRGIYLADSDSRDNLSTLTWASSFYCG